MSKGKKVEKPIFQARLRPPWLVAEAVNQRPAARAGGAPSVGPARPRPGRAHLPVGPASIGSRAEDVTALNIY